MWTYPFSPSIQALTTSTHSLLSPKTTPTLLSWKLRYKLHLISAALKSYEWVWGRDWKAGRRAWAKISKVVIFFWVILIGMRTCVFFLLFWQTKIEIKNANFFPVQVSAMNVTLTNYKSQVGLCSVQAFSVESRTSTIVSLYMLQKCCTYRCIVSPTTENCRSECNIFWWSSSPSQVCLSLLASVLAHFYGSLSPKLQDNMHKHWLEHFYPYRSSVSHCRDLIRGWGALGFPTPEVDFPSLEFLKCT